MVGDDCINYHEEFGTSTSDMVSKNLLNFIISIKVAELITLDTTNIQLNAPLMGPTYLLLKLTDIPEEIVKEYHLHKRHPWMNISMLKFKKEHTDYPIKDC